MSRDAAFWDSIAERYAARPVGNPAAYEATLERVRHWLRPDWQVLELGCGTGTTAVTLAQQVARITGTDMSDAMLRIARQRAGEAGVENADFEQAEAHLAGAGQRFDAVLAFNLLHLVADRPALFAHLRSLMPTGGMLISKTPCLAGKPWFRPLIWGMRCFGKAPSAIAFLHPDRLAQEIAAAGFEIVETGDYPKSPPSRLIVARAV